MLRLRVTVCGDGPSDRVLVEPTRWLVSEIMEERSATFEVLFADVRGTPLVERLRESVRLYPCDVLVVHRDAEAEPAARRVVEIESARSAARLTETVIPVVPVRMTEAWLLFDEDAIRRAADNPSGTIELGLPRVTQVESVLDPKQLLRESLARASEKRARRLKMFRSEMRSRVHRVAQLIESYAPLRAVDSFSRFERDLRSALEPVLQATNANRG
jgi:hypothetical protein